MTALDWLQFLGLHLSWSLLAVGGAMTLAPGLHRELVLHQGWLSEAQFQGCVTLAQATPGPNVMYIALAGWTVGANMAGRPGPGAPLLQALLPPLGLLLALGGVLLPSSVLACTAARWLHRHRERLAVRAFRQGMAPVVVGVMLATAWLLARAVLAAPGHAASVSPEAAWALMLASTGWVLATRVHLLWLIAAGGLAGAWLAVQA